MQKDSLAIDIQSFVACCLFLLLTANLSAQTAVAPLASASVVAPPPLPFIAQCANATVLLDPAPSASTLGPIIDAHGLRDPLKLVTSTVVEFCAHAPRGQMTQPMREAIARPFAIAETAANAAKSIIACSPSIAVDRRASPQRAAAELVCATFNSTSEILGPYQGSLPVSGAQGAIYAMDFLLNEPRLKCARALTDRPSTQECRDFLRMLTEEVSPSAETAEKYADFAARASHSMDTSDAGLMRAIAVSLAHIDVDFGVTADWKSQTEEPLPQALATAVSGPILAAQEIDGLGWIVVGSLSNNTYDMSRIAGVFDPGGDDTYTWSTLRIGSQGIIDLAGNDQYKGGDEQGPAAGIFGLSVIEDFAGDDQYSGPYLACGVGLFGVGILIDHAGHDTYRCGKWSIGVGILGAGFLFDQEGSDQYQAAAYSQALGGPLGIGALVDSSGNDFYELGRSVRSVDGVAGVWYAMGQGVGFGARRLIAGGIGLLADFGGDDRYEAGEFAQGGGYYYGFGMLLDESGSDFYRGTHYSQGFTAHQAAGVLIDLAGDDSYWSMISASQGAAWDTSISLLLDASGNDSYRGNALCQGSAAEQSIAMLCDLDGSDHYLGLGPFVQGESGENSYHFAQTKARSFSVLIDAGTGSDFFSAKRTIDGVTITGPAPSADAPASATLFGVMIDRPVQVPTPFPTQAPTQVPPKANR